MHSPVTPEITDKDLAFWRKHCAVVPLGTEAAEEAKRRKNTGHKKYAPQTCHRCHIVKHADGRNAPTNHKLKHCADGVQSKNEREPPPPFPQPQGVFKDGTEFNPIKFLETIRRLNEFSGSEEDRKRTPPELTQFSKMLDERQDVRVVPSGTGGPDKQVIYFKLYNSLTCNPPCTEIMEIEGDVHWLRIECLGGR